MDTERELVELKKTVNENNRILKNLQSRARIHTVIYVVKWVIIILAALGIYTVIQPVIESITGTYGSIKDSAATIAEIKASIPDPESNAFLNFFKKEQ
jgi:hypothetical protein